MSKEQMMQARDLIIQKRYDEARVLLRNVDHDVARQWLAKLDEIAPESSTPALNATAPDPAESLKAQIRAARDLILARQYAQAREILQGVDHPTARQWLDKLDQLARAKPAAGYTPPTETAPADAPPAEAAAPEDEPAQLEPVTAAELPREEQEKRLIEVQNLILGSKFDAAKVLLDDLTLPEAAPWRDKTQMNKFREFQSLWLDLYYYDVDDSGAAEWRCNECGRDRAAALACPQRGHKPCPVVLKEHALNEPNRLALVLGSIYMDQTHTIKPILKGVDFAKLAEWRVHLERQLNATWEHDIRRPALETAIMLLHQLEQTRKLQA